jgi:hypothetical protein
VLHFYGFGGIIDVTLVSFNDEVIAMEWLLFLSQLPASPSTPRVMVWRRMKAAGAVGLQNGVWVLPHTPEQERFLEELLDYVQEQHASGQVLIVRPANEAVQQDILARFRADRDQEYDEFCEQCQIFLAEVEKETARLKFTFAELEENEQNLQRLTGWLPKIQARDFFGGSQAEAAASAMEQCRQALEVFANQVYAQEGMDTADEAIHAGEEES